MIADERYADASVWDARHRAILAAGDRDRSSEWLAPFLPLLAAAAARDVLDLGCGTGYDALALAARGFAVAGIDHSRVALAEAGRLARERSLDVAFREGDIGGPLPYADAAFDAAISNLVLHSFPDEVVRGIVAEVARCLRPGGLFLFHVNSTADLARRTATQVPERRLGPTSFVLAGGQTMHFFSRAYCEDLLAGWSDVRVEAVTSCDASGAPVKSVWRCTARKAP
jgi:SAM-dependent methyltransferase